MSIEHGRERLRLLRLAVALGSAERVVTSICAAARVSLFVYGLTARDYGLYVVVLNIVASANLLDFGLHNGALTAIATANGRDDHAAIRAITSTATVIYSAVAAAALAVCIPLVWIGPTGRILGVVPDQVHDARWLAVFGILTLVLVLPLKIVSALLSGLQQNFLASAYRSAAAVGSTLLVASAVYSLHGRVIPIAAIVGAADVFFLAGFAVWIFARKYPQYRPQPSGVTRSLVRPLLTSGSTFLVTNLANLLRRSAPPLWIGRELGTAAVPTFSISFSLFVIALSFSDLVAGSFWPAWGEAAARQDWAWVSKTFRSGATGAIAVATLLALLGAVLGADVIKLWTPSAVPPSKTLLMWLGVWLFTQTIFYFCYAMLNGLGQNRLVMWSLLCEGGAVFALGRIAARTAGIQGEAAMIALCGLVGSSALIFLVRIGSERRVAFPVGAVVRVFVIAAATYAAARAVLTHAPPLLPIVRILLFAPMIAVVYGTSAWFLALPPEARAVVARLVKRRAAT